VQEAPSSARAGLSWIIICHEVLSVGQPTFSQLISNPPRLPLFTLNPPHAAGRRARRGWEFQDWYIAYVLAGFWAGDDDFAVARLEGVEDLDVVLRVDGWWVERYYQIKSRAEGSGNWTLRQVQEEGVLSRFLNLYREFRERCADQRRRAEFIIAVEGDLDKDLSELKKSKGARAKTKARLFALLVLGVLVSRKSSYKKCGSAITKWFASNAERLLCEPPRGLRNPGEIGALSASLVGPIGGKQDEIASELFEAQRFVIPLFEGFIEALKLESRVGALEEAVFARLMHGGDLSPDEARAAVQRLMSSIRDESTTVEPTNISPDVFRAWLGAPRRTVLQAKPLPSQHTVRRGEVLQTLKDLLKREPVVFAYGFPKVGKTQLLSALIDEEGKSDSYFWFTFTGEQGDQDRFMRQVSVWFGQRTSVWQVRDDVEAGRLQLTQLVDRLSAKPIDGAWIVFDDCHKCADKKLFEIVRALIVSCWRSCRLLLISEEKIAEVPDTLAYHVRVGGLTPRESVELTAKLGLDVSEVLVQYALLCAQVDGHPVMLRAIVQELPKRPSETDVSSLAKRLPTVRSAQEFLAVLSGRYLQLARGGEQRAWLARLAALPFSFGRSTAFALAQIDPKISATPADWLYLTSLMLDESRPGRYSIPSLLRTVARSDLDSPSSNTLLTAFARDVFRTAWSSRGLDFWDFHNAVVALAIAGEVEEAAGRLIFSAPDLMRMGSFEPVEFLFMILNGEPVQQKIPDVTTRWILLQLELTLRLQDEKVSKRPKIVALLGRLRVLLRAESDRPSKRHQRATFHSMVSAVRVRDLSTKAKATAAEMQRAFAPLQQALRLAISDLDWQLVSNLAGIYSQIYILASNPDVEVVRTALIGAPSSEPSPFSPEALISVYSKFGIRMKHSGLATEVVERHSKEYLANGQTDAYFACEHALAEILMDGQKKYSQARERIGRLLEGREEFRLSTEATMRAHLFIGDSYWAEKNYQPATIHYEEALKGSTLRTDLCQYISERYLDSLIFLRQFDTAARWAAAALRRRGPHFPPTYMARLYARLAYAYAEGGMLKKAAISCYSLCRLARSEGSDDLDGLSATLAAWVLCHIDYAVPGIPRNEVYIRDSAALSESATEDQMRAWRTSDPTRTKGLFCIATIFELLGELRRAEFLCNTAITILRGSGAAENDRLRTEYPYLLRLAGVQIQRGKLREAVDSFKKAHQSAFELWTNERGQTLQRGGCAYVLLEHLDAALAARSDSEVFGFFDLLEDQWQHDGGVLAWLSYREGEVLLSRMLVQAGKRKFLEAERRATSTADQALHWTVLRQKLFYHVGHFYLRHDEWLKDLLEVALLFATDERYSTYETAFADDVDKFSHAQTRGPLSHIARTIDGFRLSWTGNSFLVAVYGIWRMAKQQLVLTSSLNEIESLLRQSATFLSPNDF